MSELEEKQQRYCSYLENNPRKCPIELSGFYSSTRNNPVFINTEHTSHTKVVELLQQSLNNISEQYKTQRTLLQFEQDVLTLKQIMEKSDYSDCLIDGTFKISHAQKSLSVYLKYLWCKDSKSYHQPPASPIDSNVMCRLGWPMCRKRWTQMDDDMFHDILECLQNRADQENQSIAEMELCWYDEMVINKDKVNHNE